MLPERPCIRFWMVSYGVKMSVFDDVKESNERKFVLEAEQEFKAEARRNKYIGQWAAGLFGLDEAETEKYILAVIVSDMEEAGDDDVFRKVKADFVEHGVEMSDVSLRQKMNSLIDMAREEIFKEISA